MEIIVGIIAFGPFVAGIVIFCVLFSSGKILKNHSNTYNGPERPKEPPQEPPQRTPAQTAPEPIEQTPVPSFKEYNYHVHGLTHPNEDGKDPVALIRKAVRVYDEYDIDFRKIKKTDFQDDPDMEYPEFDQTEFDCDLVPTTFGDAPAVKVYLVDDDENRFHIGWIPAEKAADVSDMIKKHDCAFTLSVDGGKIKTFDGEKIDVSEERPIFVDVNITYSD